MRIPKNMAIHDATCGYKRMRGYKIECDDTKYCEDATQSVRIKYRTWVNKTEFEDARQSVRIHVRV
jgi:hypothetical protein